MYQKLTAGKHTSIQHVEFMSTIIVEIGKPGYNKKANKIH